VWHPPICNAFTNFATLRQEKGRIAEPSKKESGNKAVGEGKSGRRNEAIQ